MNTATLKIGFPYKLSQRYVYDVVVPRSDLNFEIEEMVDMLKIFGHTPAVFYRHDVPGTPCKGERPYVLYFTTASSRAKCWPRERFVALIKRMADAVPTSDHAVLAGKEAWKSTDQLKKDLQHKANVSFVNVDTVNEVISIVKDTTMVNSNDTSVRNIASATGVPSIGVFLNTALFGYLPMYVHHRVVYNRDGEAPSVDQVFKSSLSLLEQTVR